MSSSSNPTDFASLPNSRNSSRASTKNADTHVTTAIFSDVAGPIDVSLLTDAQKTDINLRGQITTNGNTIFLEANRNRTYAILRNVDSAETIVYGHVDRATLKDDGMILRAGEPVELDSLNLIFIKSVATDSSDIETRGDVGQG